MSRRTRRERGTKRPRGVLARMFRLVLGLALLLLVASAAAVAALRWLDPPSSAFMVLDALGIAGSDEPVRHHWVDRAAISPHCALAAIAAEDQRFPEHPGFDMESIADAIDAYRAGRRLRGASTITQQVAKNLFLWPERSVLRKGLEAWFTTLIEAMWPKWRTLEIYLNVAEFGRGVYGVGAAAEWFFRASPAGLSARQCALLAAVLPAPRRLRVDAPSDYVMERQRWILRQMRQLGGIAYLDRL